MSKHKTSKTLIIEEDDDKVVEDRLNPFSFKEFIRSKNQTPEQRDPEERNHSTQKKASSGGGSLLEERGCSSQGLGATEDQQAEEEEEEEEEEEWTGSYQPSLEEAHVLGLSGPYSDQTSLGAEEEEEEEEGGASLWPTDGEYSPEMWRAGGVGGARRGRGASIHYKGDEEPSVAEPPSTADHHQQLREENAELRRHITRLLKKTERDANRISQLTAERQHRRVQEEREAQTLDTMVLSVEHNLSLMTKRALKAENAVSKLRQELHQTQGQLESCRCEKERLLSGEAAMKHTAQLASHRLNTAAHNAHTSIRQLMSGAETLCLVSQLLASMDHISELPNEG